MIAQLQVWEAPTVLNVVHPPKQLTTLPAAPPNNRTHELNAKTAKIGLLLYLASGNYAFSLTVFEHY